VVALRVVVVMVLQGVVIAWLLVRRRAGALLVGRARLGLALRLRLAVVMVVRVTWDVVAREAEVDAAKGFPLRQQLAELRVQLLQAKLRHKAPLLFIYFPGVTALRAPGHYASLASGQQRTFWISVSM